MKQFILEIIPLALLKLSTNIAKAGSQKHFLCICKEAYLHNKVQYLQLSSKICDHLLLKKKKQERERERKENLKPDLQCNSYIKKWSTYLCLSMGNPSSFLFGMRKSRVLIKSEAQSLILLQVSRFPIVPNSSG